MTSQPPPIPKQIPPPIRVLAPDPPMQPDVFITQTHPYALPPPQVVQSTHLETVKKNETLAILSLVLSLSPAILIFIPGLNILGLLAPIAGIILGFIAKKKIAQSPKAFSGAGLATGGIISGFVMLGLIILVVIVITIITAIAGAVTTAASNILTQTISNLLNKVFAGW